MKVERIPLVVLSLLSIFALERTAKASEVREVVYHGQASESFDMKDRVKESKSWGDRSGTDVLAHVNLVFGKAPDGVSPEETFVVKLDEDSLTVSLKSSGKVLVSQEVPVIKMDRSPHRLSIDASYSFSFIDIAPIAAVLTTGMAKVDVANGSLFFEASPEFFERQFTLRLSISKKRFLRRSEIVFDRSITSESLKRIPTEDGKILYSSNLMGLGVPALEEGRYAFDLYVSFDSGSSSVMNADDLPHSGRLHEKAYARKSDTVRTR